MTEMRPGVYVYGDANQVTLGSRSLDECALGVVAMVVSTPTRDCAVIDAGTKALSVDAPVPGLIGFGTEHPAQGRLRVRRIGSPQHGHRLVAQDAAARWP